MFVKNDQKCIMKQNQIITSYLLTSNFDELHLETDIVLQKFGNSFKVILNIHPANNLARSNIGKPIR